MAFAKTHGHITSGDARRKKDIFIQNRAPQMRFIYGAQNETYNDGKDVKWWNALSAKELRV